MKQKKYLWSLLTIIMAAVMSVGFTSCGDDDDDSQKDIDLEKLLREYGWKASPYYDFLEWGNNNLSFTEETITLFFLDNSKGINKVVSNEIDTHFGEEKTTYALSFTYTIQGQSVKINNGVNTNTYHYQDGALVDSKGSIAYSKVSITNNDREWIESQQLALLPDTERLKINFSHGCDVMESESTDKNKSYLVLLSLKIDASQKAHSRLIDVVRGSYKISGGKFSTTPKVSLLINDDKGGEASTGVIVETASEAIISATFEAYDRKYGKYVIIGSAEYKVSGSAVINGGDNNGGDNNGGDNNSGDSNGYDLADMSSVHTKAIKYKIDKKEYKMILVEGGSMPDFYIMQTEVVPQKDLDINGTTVQKVDRNNDNVVIKTEFSAFLIRLRKATNMPFRLPTKAEWQYAARGGNKSKGYKYSGSNSINDVAWYYSNSNNKAHDIVTKQPNELGIYDMSGNYAELCNDTKDEYNIDDTFSGGSWKNSEYKCTVTSWEQGITSGKIKGKNTRERNAFDASYISFRLVYTKQ